MEDSVEMLQARNVAITHVCFELLAALFCPTGTLCVFTAFLAVLLSSVVACCCKHRTTYMLWSWFGCVLLTFHLIAAAGAFDAEYFFPVSDLPGFVFFLQMFLCGVNVRMMYLGCVISTASRERGLHDPVGMQLEMPTLGPMYPAAEVQDAELRRV